jgi:2-isopropylmalate synthase
MTTKDRIMTPAARSEKDRVLIFDTTLRDGEQCPGATMTHEEKLEVAELLDQMGVDIIEAGFPIASEGDFAAVQEIARRSRNAVICGLSRAAFNDIDRCAEAIKPAKRRRIHTFLSTSPVHMKYKLQKEPHEVYEMVIAQVTRARNHTDDVEWSSEDTRPHRSYDPPPLRGGCDQRRRHHHQYSTPAIPCKEYFALIDR